MGGGRAHIAVNCITIYYCSSKPKDTYEQKDTYIPYGIYKVYYKSTTKTTAP